MKNDPSLNVFIHNINRLSRQIFINHKEIDFRPHTIAKVNDDMCTCSFFLVISIKEFSSLIICTVHKLHSKTANMTKIC